MRRELTIGVLIVLVVWAVFAYGQFPFGRSNCPGGNCPGGNCPTGIRTVPSLAPPVYSTQPPIRSYLGEPAPQLQMAPAPQTGPAPLPALPEVPKSRGATLPLPVPPAALVPLPLPPTEAWMGVDLPRELPESVALPPRKFVHRESGALYEIVPLRRGASLVVLTPEGETKVGDLGLDYPELERALREVYRLAHKHRDP